CTGAEELSITFRNGENVCRKGSIPSLGASEAAVLPPEHQLPEWVCGQCVLAFPHFSFNVMGEKNDGSFARPIEDTSWVDEIAHDDIEELPRQKISNRLTQLRPVVFFHRVRMRRSKVAGVIDEFGARTRVWQLERHENQVVK